MMASITLRTKDGWEKKMKVDIAFIETHASYKMAFRLPWSAWNAPGCGPDIRHFRQTFHDATLYEEI